MTYLGNWKAIMQTGGNSEVTGYVSLILLPLVCLKEIVWSGAD